MASETDAQKARCLHCREEISVPDRYAHGDHVKCGACRTKHKVVRADRLRLVLADVGPLRDALGQNQQLVSRLEAELAHARASFGIGVNGIGIGVIFVLYQVGMKGAPLSAEPPVERGGDRDRHRAAARGGELVLPREAERDHAHHPRARRGALRGQPDPAADAGGHPGLRPGAAYSICPPSRRAMTVR